MNVAELISKLLTCEPDAKIYVDNEFSSVKGENEIVEIHTPTPQVCQIIIKNTLKLE